MMPVQIFGERNRVAEPTARMRAHQIRHHVLAVADFALAQKLFVHLLKFLHEGIVGRHVWLPHLPENRVRDMLRRDPQLAAHMVLAKLAQEASVLVREKVVKPESRADKNLLHAGQLSQRA